MAIIQLQHLRRKFRSLLSLTNSAYHEVGDGSSPNEGVMVPIRNSQVEEASPAMPSVSRGEIDGGIDGAG